MAPTIVLLGPPGSGKGTQAARLCNELGFVALVTGDLLRAARATGTDLGRRASRYMDHGELVPDELVVGMIEEAIVESAAEPILLDGFPRSVAQARALDGTLAAHARELTA
jgi:adenylate kinase